MVSAELVVTAVPVELEAVEIHTAVLKSARVESVVMVELVELVVLAVPDSPESQAMFI